MDIHFGSQSEFIKSAFHFYRKKTHSFSDDHYCPYHREEIVHWLYKLGRDYNVLNMDYAEFRRVLRGEQKNYYWGGNGRRNRGYSGRWSHYCDPELYRVLRDFTYNGQPKKNNPTKKDWWGA